MTSRHCGQFALLWAPILLPPSFLGIPQLRVFTTGCAWWPCCHSDVDCEKACNCTTLINSLLHIKLSVYMLFQRVYPLKCGECTLVHSQCTCKCLIAESNIRKSLHSYNLVGTLLMYSMHDACSGLPHDHTSICLVLESIGQSLCDCVHNCQQLFQPQFLYQELISTSSNS